MDTGAAGAGVLVVGLGVDGDLGEEVAGAAAGAGVPPLEWDRIPFVTGVSSGLPTRGVATRELLLLRDAARSNSYETSSASFDAVPGILEIGGGVGGVRPVERGGRVSND